MSFLLELEIQPDQPIESFLNRLEYGGQTLLLGMASVFAVLTIIMLTLLLFKLFFYDLPAKKAEDAIVSEPEVSTPAVVASNDDEIIAVIAAAIATAESESNGAKFRVVSFRRK